MKMRISIKVILLVHLLMYIAIALNILIVRQTICFIYLSFIPGFVLLRILRLKKIDIVDTILFSIGLSIAFSMFIGLLINGLYPLLGISRPLTTIPLTITLSALTLALLLVGYKQDLSRNLNASGWRGMELKAILPQALFLVFPSLLGIMGALYVNTSILLFMIIVIATLYALSVSSTRLIPAKLYPLMIFAISIALLFHTSLISKYIMGADIHLEYYVFKLTETNGHWHSPGIVKNYLFSSCDLANFGSLLSITILPTIYSLLLNIRGEMIFKVIYPFIFSLIPLVLYRIYERQTGKLVALLSTLFFISNPYVFYGGEPLGLTRQMIGELFFVLSIFLLVDKKIALQKKQALFMIFGAALVVSHYSLSYIYLSYVVVIFVLSEKASKKMLNGAMVLLLITMTLSWYMFTSDSPLYTLTFLFKRIPDTFITDLFSPEARSSYVYSRLSSPAQTIAILIDRILLYILQFFILIGIIELIVRKKGKKFDSEYRLMSILSIFILLLCIFIPHFAPAFNLTRLYGVTLLFLAPFIPLGGKAVFSWMKKAGIFLVHRLGRVSYGNLELRLVSILLIASFLFQVGFVHHVTKGVPASNSLDFNRKKTTNDLRIKISFYNAYIPEQDVFSAIWLSKNVDETSRLHADRNSENVVLTSYGLIDRVRVHLLSNSTILEDGDYIYLRRLNVVDGLISTFPVGEPFHISEISSLLNESNKIYSNGDSDIYCVPGN